MLLNESVEDYLRYAAHEDLKPDNIEQMRRKVKLRPEIKKIEENVLQSYASTGIPLIYMIPPVGL